MDRIGIGHLGGAQNTRDVPVALVSRRRPDADVLVGNPDMQRIGIGFRMDGDCPDAEFLACPDDTHGDFAPVGNQDLFE